MKIKVYVVQTCIPERGEKPLFPSVFATPKAAEAYADARLREEWDAAGLCDDNGDALPYPGNWREANRAIAAEISDGSWGEWELTVHEIDLGPLAVVMEGGVIQRVLSAGPLAGGEVAVIEYTDRSDDWDAMIPQDHGEPARAVTGSIKIGKSKAWLERALAAIPAKEAA